MCHSVSLGSVVFQEFVPDVGGNVVDCLLELTSHVILRATVDGS